MRQAAGPHAWIFSFDPDGSHLQYNDTSGKTSYFLDNSWTDIEEVDWDTLIAEEHRGNTLIMLDDHQSVMSRIPKLLSLGFTNYWYDDNTKYNDNCYSFSWLCDPLPKNQSQVELVDAWSTDTVNISIEDHKENLAYLQERLVTYFEFPAIHDGCANDTSASLISSEDQLQWWGLPSVKEETYGYSHFPPPFVQFRAPDEIVSTIDESTNDTSLPPLLRQLAPGVKRKFWQTLNRSLILDEPVETFWASYTKQTGVPMDIEDTVYAHTYWHGPYTQKPALSVKSFLATQNMRKVQLVLWLDAETYENNEDIEFVQSHGVEVRLFNFSEEVKGTPLEGVFDTMETTFAGHEDWPVERTAADLVRYIVLSKHGGGLWFDSDVLFLRDIYLLLPYEFVYPWSKHGSFGLPEDHTLNGALLRLFANSSANEHMISRVAIEKLPFGLWGLSSLRDNTRHSNLNIVDVEKFDALWKDEKHFSASQRAQLLSTEKTPETSRFHWFFSSDVNEREAGFSVLSSANAFTYHWHNNYDRYVEPGSAFSLYETFVDCLLTGGCTTVADELQLASRYSLQQDSLEEDEPASE
jgi:hypothetical protein